MGALSARVHEHAATFRAPSYLPVRTLHELIGRGERDVLFTHDIPLFVPSARRVVFGRVAERFRQEIDALYAEPAGRRVIRRPHRRERASSSRPTQIDHTFGDEPYRATCPAHV